LEAILEWQRRFIRVGTTWLVLSDSRQDFPGRRTAPGGRSNVSSSARDADSRSVIRCDKDNETMAKCLVTGGAGFIGSHLTELLLSQGHFVVVLDNLSTGQAINLDDVKHNNRLEIRQGSITDPVALAEAVHGVDMIFHLAAAVGVKLVADDPVRTIETNIYPTDQLLRLAVQGSVKKFFLASTSEVYGKHPGESWVEDDDLHLGPTSRPRWAYGCSKAIDEFLALAYHRKYKLGVTIGRFFNVVGPRQVGNYGMVVPRFVEAALKGGPVIVYDDGSQVRCFAHVREITQCVSRLMMTDPAEGQVFNIGSDQPVSILELAQRVIAKIDPAVAIEFVPYAQAYSADFEDVQRRVPNVDRLFQTIGRKPVEPLETILDDIIAWKRTTLMQ
jgi:UDP-glucose 4-epimerase